MANPMVTSLTVNVGDAFLFDPTTPHLAMPERPHQDQFLILMQAQLADYDEEDRAKLMKYLGSRQKTPAIRRRTNA